VRSGKPLIAIFLFVISISFEVKGQYNFTVDNAEGCNPMKVKFSFLSTASTDSVDTYYWDFGNGSTSALADPDSVVYENEGKYNLTLILRFSGGSELWIVKPDSVTVHGSPVASFDYDNPSPTPYFMHLQQNGVTDTGSYYTFDWDIQDIGSRTGASVNVEFPDFDTFSVTLTVTDLHNCTASQTKDIPILEHVTVQNVFTPGGDDTENNYFIIRSAGDIPLRIKIYSRTGILVYEAEGPVITWDGETASGDKLKTGVYFYTLEAITGDPNKLYTKAGFVHMYRKD
jgi:gliding motility-associated-like protein